MKTTRFIDSNINRIDQFIKSDLRNSNSSALGYPLFSSLEFSINDSCNRRCFFCPRVDEDLYPNRGRHLGLGIYKKIIKELVESNYKGRISFSGFCEPLLTKDIDHYIAFARQEIPDLVIELVSNGDVLQGRNGVSRLRRLFDAGLNNIRISLYDGPYQDEIFLELKRKLGLDDDQFILRQRYLSADESYGMTISNRGGALDFKDGTLVVEPLKESLRQPCYYPFYKLLVDYDASVLICSNDWSKKRVVGSCVESSIDEIWFGERFMTIRRKLMNSDRNIEPCRKCDVDGCMNGLDHFLEWKKKIQLG